jgi:putative folate metabolism gamma-glutamate ligase
MENIFDQYLPKLEEGSVIAITSKVISISQGRVVFKEGCVKRELVAAEADFILETANNPYDLYLTIKNNILIPSAGIDESNCEGVYVLYPDDVQALAKSYWDYLRQKHKINHLGIIITDSHTTPMRRGVTGIALGWCGFIPLYSYIGKPDIYNKPLRVTQVNLLDSLAVAAVLLMGEGDEKCPMVVIEDAPKLEFIQRHPTEEEVKSVTIAMEDDIYAPLLKAASWRKHNK